MDRLARLQEAYRRALEAGEGILKALREPPGVPVVDQVESLVSQREAAVREAAELFQAGDQALFEQQLQALLDQQQLLSEEMRRFMDELAGVSQSAAQMKSTVRSARQMLNAGRRGRMLDQRL